MTNIFKIIPVLIILSIVYSCSNYNKSLEQSKKITNIIKTLSDKKYSGRLTGTKGNEMASRFIEEKFRDIGLEYINDKDSYYNEYSHIFYKPDYQTFEMKFIFPNGEEKNLIRGNEFLEKTNFTNYSATSLITNDINDPNISEKFILLENKNQIQAVFEKAKGILIKEDQFFRTIIVDGLKKPIIQVNQAVYDSIKNEENIKVGINSYSKMDYINAVNIVGKIKGKESKNAIILSAHFDHVGWVNNQIYRGAIDNASGISIMLDVASKVKDYSNQNPLAQDIIICAFNGEESGRQGSMNFIDSIKGQYNNIYNINFDSIYERKTFRIAAEESNVNLANDLYRFLTERELPVLIDTSLSTESDHISFIENEINAVSFGQNILDKIHTSADNIDEIDVEFIQKISEIIYKFIITNDDKIYPYNSKPTSISHESEEDFSKLEEFIDKEKQKLKFGEYMYVERDKYNVLIQNDSGEFEDIKEFNRYYSKIQPPIEIDNYSLESLYVVDGSIPESSVDKEINKIYSSKILEETIQILNLQYENNEDNHLYMLNILINRTNDENFEINNENLKVKDGILNNKKISYLYDSNGKLSGVSYVSEIDGNKFIVNISQGEKVTIEKEGKKIDGLKIEITEEFIRQLITSNNLFEVIDKILNTLIN